MSNNIPFMKGMRIITGKIPVYETFRKPFTIHVNKNHLNALANIDRVKTNPSVVETLKNVSGKIKGGTLEITYAPRHELGRFYPNDGMSLVSLPREVKHTLYKSMGYVDIDMVKAHTSILAFIQNATPLTLAPTGKIWVLVRAL